MRSAASLRLALAAALAAAVLSSSGACRGTTQDRHPSTDAVDETGMVAIPAGTFLMGTADGPADEGPVHVVELRAFTIDRHEVTMRDFRPFVDATGYHTDAEVAGWSGVFDIERAGWTAQSGATWRRPDGPSGAPASDEEPVTQVSWADAAAYARWVGKRLPTEAEWEYAARGGLQQSRYVWGDELRPAGRPVANWWQGAFPNHDTGEDGFRGRAPVGRFPANGYGLVDMSGNVWEWCADWFDEDYYAAAPRIAPAGPASGTERVLRGGSWLCSESYCAGYRPGARMRSAPDTGLNNVGFRLVKDVS